MKKKLIVVLSIVLVVIICFLAFIKIREEKTNNTENVNEHDLIINEEIHQNETVNSSVENEIKVEIPKNEESTQNTINSDNETENKKEENIITEEKKVEDKKTNPVNENKQEIKNSNEKIIVIDPGHQTKGDSSKEPIGPGATETKAKVTTGATGVSTKQTESELNLKVALKLESELKQRGYKVIMTRKINDVNISNKERAEIANNANADAFIRIHADSVDNETVNRNVYIMPNYTK